MLVLLVSTLLFSVSRAEEPLFVLKGSSVRLDLQGYDGLGFRSLSWLFNISTAILEYTNKSKDLELFNTYKTRAEFDKKNFSLLLKNMQERDNGIYTAEIADDKGKRRYVATYRLRVQEAPPTPQVGVVLLSSAGGFCMVLVTCSAYATWASYICDHAHCTQAANTTLSTEVKITVTATNEAISCSSSNRVGTKTQSTKHVCAPVTPSPGLSLCELKSVLFSLGLVAMVSAVIAVNARERCCRDQSGLREKDKSVRGEA